MSEGDHLKRVERALEPLGHIPDPLLRLDTLRRARERVEMLETRAVRDARHAGVTWKAIGALYGLSKQGAHQRFRGEPPGEGSPPVAGPPQP